MILALAFVWILVLVLVLIGFLVQALAFVQALVHSRFIWVSYRRRGTR